LKNECGLSVTLHPFREDLILCSELRTFNIHDNSYCVYVKTNPDAWAHCIERQQKILKKCEEGSFCGNCFAGVREYIYPIRAEDGIKGFISVSGYRCENAPSYIARASEQYHLSREGLAAAYASLKSCMPDKARVDTLIEPLCQMLELAYRKREATGEKSLCDAVAQYLMRHHTSPITLDDVSRAFYCSRSHISHHFKKQMGKSVREYLTELRVEDAKRLLRHSELSVTEIAYSVGFGDSNYFSAVFKKNIGLSPLAYRKTVKKNTSEEHSSSEAYGSIPLR
jgi:AraC-like DNA-binding protein